MLIIHVTFAKPFGVGRAVVYLHGGLAGVGSDHLSKARPITSEFVLSSQIFDVDVNDNAMTRSCFDFDVGPVGRVFVHSLTLLALSMMSGTSFNQQN